MNEFFIPIIQLLAVILPFFLNSLVKQSVKKISSSYKREVFYLEYFRYLSITIYLIVIKPFININVDNIYISSFAFILLICYLVIIFVQEVKIVKVKIRNFNRSTYQNLLLFLSVLPYYYFTIRIFANFNSIGLSDKSVIIAYFIILTIVYVFQVIYTVHSIEKIYFISRKIIVRYRNRTKEEFDDVIVYKNDYVLIKYVRDNNISRHSTIIISKQDVYKIMISEETTAF